MRHVILVLLARAAPGALRDRLSAAGDEACAHAMAALHDASTWAMLFGLSDWIVLHPSLRADAAREYATRQVDNCRYKM